MEGERTIVAPVIASLRETFAKYEPPILGEEYYDVVNEIGTRLVERVGWVDTADSECFARTALQASALEHDPDSVSSRRLGSHAMSVVGSAWVTYRRVRATDPGLRTHAARERLLGALQSIPNALYPLMNRKESRRESQYWVVRNASRCLASIATALTRLGPKDEHVVAEAALPPLVWIMWAMDACTPLWTPRHWPWRTRVATVAADTARQANAFPVSHAILSATLQALQRLESEVESDPPVMEGTRFALGQARFRLRVAQWSSWMRDPATPLAHTVGVKFAKLQSEWPRREHQLLVLLSGLTQPAGDSPERLSTSASDEVARSGRIRARLVAGQAAMLVSYVAALVKRRAPAVLSEIAESSDVEIAMKPHEVLTRATEKARVTRARLAAERRRAAQREQDDEDEGEAEAEGGGRKQPEEEEEVGEDRPWTSEASGGMVDVEQDETVRATPLVLHATLVEVAWLWGMGDIVDALLPSALARMIAARVMASDVVTTEAHGASFLDSADTLEPPASPSDPAAAWVAGLLLIRRMRAVEMEEGGDQDNEGAGGDEKETGGGGGGGGLRKRKRKQPTRLGRGWRVGLESLESAATALSLACQSRGGATVHRHAAMIRHAMRRLYRHTAAVTAWLESHSPSLHRNGRKKTVARRVLETLWTALLRAGPQAGVEDDVLYASVGLRVGLQRAEEGNLRAAIQLLRQARDRVQSARDVHCGLFAYDLAVDTRCGTGTFSGNRQDIAAVAKTTLGFSFDGLCPLVAQPNDDSATEGEQQQQQAHPVSTSSVQQRPGRRGEGKCDPCGEDSAIARSQATVACLHADLVAATFATELLRGMSSHLHQRSPSVVPRGNSRGRKRSPSKRARQTPQQSHRGQTPGSLTNLDGTPIRHCVPPSVETRLRSECGSNHEWHSLLSLALVRYGMSAEGRHAILVDAMRSLEAAEAQRDELQQWIFPSSDNSSQSDLADPMAFLLGRGSQGFVWAVASGSSSSSSAASVSSSSALESRQRRRRGQFAVALLGKPLGSGTQVVATSSALPGTGRSLRRVGPTLPDGRPSRIAIVRGVRPNGSFNFAAGQWAVSSSLSKAGTRPTSAENDGFAPSEGTRVGRSSSAMVAATPLPHSLLWLYIAWEASRVGAGDLVRPAALRACHGFIVRPTARPPWRESPAAWGDIRRDRLSQAPRAVVQAVALSLGLLGMSRSGGVGPAANDTKDGTGSTTDSGPLAAVGGSDDRIPPSSRWSPQLAVDESPRSVADRVMLAAQGNSVHHQMAAARRAATLRLAAEVAAMLRDPYLVSLYVSAGWDACIPLLETSPTFGGALALPVLASLWASVSQVRVEALTSHARAARLRVLDALLRLTQARVGGMESSGSSSSSSSVEKATLEHPDAVVAVAMRQLLQETRVPREPSHPRLVRVTLGVGFDQAGGAMMLSSWSPSSSGWRGKDGLPLQVGLRVVAVEGSVPTPSLRSGAESASKNDVVAWDPPPWKLVRLGVGRTCFGEPEVATLAAETIEVGESRAVSRAGSEVSPTPSPRPGEDFVSSAMRPLAWGRDGMQTPPKSVWVSGWAEVAALLSAWLHAPVFLDVVDTSRLLGQPDGGEGQEQQQHAREDSFARAIELVGVTPVDDTTVSLSPNKDEAGSADPLVVPSPLEEVLSEQVISATTEARLIGQLRNASDLPAMWSAGWSALDAAVAEVKRVSGKGQAGGGSARSESKNVDSARSSDKKKDKKKPAPEKGKAAADGGETGGAHGGDDTGSSATLGRKLSVAAVIRVMAEAARTRLGRQGSVDPAWIAHNGYYDKQWTDRADDELSPSETWLCRVETMGRDYLRWIHQQHDPRATTEHHRGVDDDVDDGVHGEDDKSDFLVGWAPQLLPLPHEKVVGNPLSGLESSASSSSSSSNVRPLDPPRPFSESVAWLLRVEHTGSLDSAGVPTFVQEVLRVESLARHGGEMEQKEMEEAVAAAMGHGETADESEGDESPRGNGGGKEDTASADDAPSRSPRARVLQQSVWDLFEEIDAGRVDETSRVWLRAMSHAALVRAEAWLTLLTSHMDSALLLESKAWLDSGLSHPDTDCSVAVRDRLVGVDSTPGGGGGGNAGLRPKKQQQGEARPMDAQYDTADSDPRGLAVDGRLRRIWPVGRRETDDVRSGDGNPDQHMDASLAMTARVWAVACVEAASASAVRARGCWAWGQCRNAVRVAWNATETAWLTPSDFAREKSGRLDWRPWWRCALCMMDMCTAVAEGRWERVWGRGAVGLGVGDDGDGMGSANGDATVGPGGGIVAGGGGGGRSTPASSWRDPWDRTGRSPTGSMDGPDPMRATPAASGGGGGNRQTGVVAGGSSAMFFGGAGEDSMLDVGGGGAPMGNQQRREVTPLDPAVLEDPVVGWSPDDLVWMARFLRFLAGSLHAAGAWDFLLSLGERVQREFPWDVMDPDWTAVPGEGPWSGAGQGPSQDVPEADVLEDTTGGDDDDDGFAGAGEGQEGEGDGGDVAAASAMTTQGGGGGSLVPANDDPSAAKPRPPVGVAPWHPFDRIATQQGRIDAWRAAATRRSRPVGGLPAETAGAAVVTLAVEAAYHRWSQAMAELRLSRAALQREQEAFDALPTQQARRRRQRVALVQASAAMSQASLAVTPEEEAFARTKRELQIRVETARATAARLQARWNELRLWVASRSRDLPRGRRAMETARRLAQRWIQALFTDPTTSSSSRGDGVVHGEEEGKFAWEHESSAGGNAIVKSRRSHVATMRSLRSGQELLDLEDEPPSIATVREVYDQTIRRLRHRHEIPLLCMTLCEWSLIELAVDDNEELANRALRDCLDAVFGVVNLADGGNWVKVLARVAQTGDSRRAPEALADAAERQAAAARGRASGNGVDLVHEGFAFPGDAAANGLWAALGPMGLLFGATVAAWLAERMERSVRMLHPNKGEEQQEDEEGNGLGRTISGENVMFGDAGKNDEDEEEVVGNDAREEAKADREHTIARGCLDQVLSLQRLCARFVEATLTPSVGVPPSAIGRARWTMRPGDWCPGCDPFSAESLLPPALCIRALARVAESLLQWGSSYVHAAVPVIVVYEYLATYRACDQRAIMDARLRRAHAQQLLGDISGALVSYAIALTGDADTVPLLTGSFASVAAVAASGSEADAVRDAGQQETAPAKEDKKGSGGKKKNGQADAAPTGGGHDAEDSGRQDDLWSQHREWMDTVKKFQNHQPPWSENNGAALQALIDMGGSVLGAPGQQNRTCPDLLRRKWETQSPALRARWLVGLAELLAAVTRVSQGIAWDARAQCGCAKEYSFPSVRLVVPGSESSSTALVSLREWQASGRSVAQWAVGRAVTLLHNGETAIRQALKRTHRGDGRDDNEEEEENGATGGHHGAKPTVLVPVAWRALLAKCWVVESDLHWESGRVHSAVATARSASCFAEGRVPPQVAATGTEETPAVVTEPAESNWLAGARRSILDHDFWTSRDAWPFVMDQAGSPLHWCLSARFRMVQGLLASLSVPAAARRCDRLLDVARQLGSTVWGHRLLLLRAQIATALGDDATAESALDVLASSPWDALTEIDCATHARVAASQRLVGARRFANVARKRARRRDTASKWSSADDALFDDENKDDVSDDDEPTDEENEEDEEETNDDDLAQSLRWLDEADAAWRLHAARVGVDVAYIDQSDPTMAEKETGSRSASHGSQGMPLPRPSLDSLFVPNLAQWGEIRVARAEALLRRPSASLVANATAQRGVAVLCHSLESTPQLFSRGWLAAGRAAAVSATSGGDWNAPLAWTLAAPLLARACRMSLSGGPACLATLHAAVLDAALVASVDSLGPTSLASSSSSSSENTSAEALLAAAVGIGDRLRALREGRTLRGTEKMQWILPEVAQVLRATNVAWRSRDTFRAEHGMSSEEVIRMAAVDQHRKATQSDEVYGAWAGDPVETRAVGFGPLSLDSIAAQLWGKAQQTTRQEDEGKGGEERFRQCSVWEGSQEAAVLLHRSRRWPVVTCGVESTLVVHWMSVVDSCRKGSSDCVGGMCWLRGLVDAWLTPAADTAGGSSGSAAGSGGKAATGKNATEPRTDGDWNHTGASPGVLGAWLSEGFGSRILAQALGLDENKREGASPRATSQSPRAMYVQWVAPTSPLARMANVVLQSHLAPVGASGQDSLQTNRGGSVQWALVGAGPSHRSLSEEETISSPSQRREVPPRWTAVSRKHSRELLSLGQSLLCAALEEAAPESGALPRSSSGDTAASPRSNAGAKGKGKEKDSKGKAGASGGGAGAAGNDEERAALLARLRSARAKPFESDLASHQLASLRARSASLLEWDTRQRANATEEEAAEDGGADEVGNRSSIGSILAEAAFWSRVWDAGQGSPPADGGIGAFERGQWVGERLMQQLR